MVKGWCFMVFLLVDISSTFAYFGLTGKGQLRQTLEFPISSLGSSYSTNNEPEPSREYERVDLSPQPMEPLTVKIKRAPTSAGDRQPTTNYNRLKNERQSGSNDNEAPSRNSAPNYYRQYRNRKRLNTLSPTSYNNEFSARENGDIDALDAALPRKKNSSSRHQRPSTQPRVRSERDSGKRRQFYGIPPNTYFVASSYTQSMPSRVNYNAGKRPKILVNGRNRTHVRLPYNPKVKQLGGYDTNSSALDSYSAFVGSQIKKPGDMVEHGKIDRRDARKLCDTFRLTRSQRKKCQRDPGLPQVLTEATQLAASECQFQFRYERWNCSLGSSRIHLLNKGNKETSFLYSISSAGLAHSVARACANGYLERCSCEEGVDDDIHDNWRWGGCGDNIKYAAKFVRRFLRSRTNSKDIRAEVDKHNSDLGIRIVKSNVKQICRCHGVSGSCTTKTCWRKVAPFYEIGKKVKRAYDKAVKVSSINNVNGRAKLVRLRRSRRRRQKHDVTVQSRDHGRSNRTSANARPPRAGRWSEIPRNKELVYLENSPRYCKRSRYSMGTKGRTCDRESNCDVVCCGRGYKTHIRLIKRQCKCHVKWCCDVQCETCTERKVVHTCK